MKSRWSLAEHDEGRIAIALEELTDSELIRDIESSLIFFLEYNNIEIPDIEEELI